MDISGTLDDCADAGSHFIDIFLTSLEVMNLDSTSQGMDASHIQLSLFLLHDYSDIFRVRLGSDRPVDVPPLEILITPSPFRFVSNHVDKLNRNQH